MYSLNSLAGVRSAKVYSLKLEGAQINYSLDDVGDVRVYNLKIDKNIKPQSAMQDSGGYEVLYERNLWETQEACKFSVDLKHQWTNAYYAAVSGIGGAVVAGVALYVVGKDVGSKFGSYARNIPSAWKSTFGKGNEDWAS